MEPWPQFFTSYSENDNILLFFSKIKIVGAYLKPKTEYVPYIFFAEVATLKVISKFNLQGYLSDFVLLKDFGL